MALVMGSDYILPFVINQTDLLAGTPFEIAAPFAGFVEELNVVVQGAVTTGGAVTVNKNGVAVAGLSVTVANAATKGTVLSDTPDKASETRKFAKGDRLSIVPAAAFDTAGAINGSLRIRSAGAQTS